MIRASLIFVLVFVFDACITANALNYSGEDTLNSELNVEYHFHLPKEYDAKRHQTYPVIYIFSYGGVSSSDRNEIWNSIDKMVENVVIEPIIAVLLDVTKSTNGDSKNIFLNQHDLIQDAINYVESHYNVGLERDSRLLLGGQMTAAYGLKHPDLFKGVVMLNFSDLFGENQWNEKEMSIALAEYVRQSVRIPIYIVAGEYQEYRCKIKKSEQIQNDSINKIIQAVLLYQQLHKVNLFQLDFGKNDRVPASPAELRIIHGDQTKKSWLRGVEGGLEHFFAKPTVSTTTLREDLSTYQSRHKGNVLSEKLRAASLVADKVIGHDELSYMVYLPHGYSPRGDINYPVLYLLHGSGGNEESWNEFWTILDMMIERNIISPVIAVAPITGDGYWIDSDKYGAIESAVIRDLIPNIDANYRTISQKFGRGIVGFSMGGFGALRYALVYPKLFSSAVLLSPAIQHDEAPVTSGAVRRGAFGEPFDLSKWNSLNYPLSLQSYLAQQHRVPMYIVAGDDEWNHISEKEDLPKYAFRYNMEVQAAKLYEHLIQSTNNDLAPCSSGVAELNIVDGGHDIDVWAGGFQSGIKYMFANGLSQSHRKLQSEITHKGVQVKTLH